MKSSTTTRIIHVVLFCLRAPLLLALFAFATHRWVVEWVPPTFAVGGLSPHASVFWVGGLALHAGLYAGYAAFFGLCDSQGWLARYKVRRTPRMAAPAGMVRSTLIEAAVDMVVVTPLAFYFLAPWVVEHLSPIDAPLPSVVEMFAEFGGALVCNEVLFYAAHRMFHEIPFLYRTVHKKHHQYVGSISIAAEWAHPVEKILANVIPTFGYHIAMGGHLYVIFLWFAWRLSETYESHSGYCFGESWLGRMGMLFPEREDFHDYHHTDNRGNFGTYLFMDMIFGTDAAWRESRAKNSFPVGVSTVPNTKKDVAG